MKTYNWNMSVQEAEGLREQAAFLRGQIAELDAQYGVVSKSEKATITRAKKQLEAQVTEIADCLEGAPPKPVDPAKVVAQALKVLKKYEEGYNSLRQGFLDRAQVNPADAVRWTVESLLVAQEMYSVVHRVMEWKRRENGDEWTLDGIAEVCEKVKEQAINGIRHYDPLSLSTCAFSNLAEAAKYNAYTRLLGDSYNSIGYVLAMVGWCEEAIAAWKQLQEEMS